MTCHSSLWKCQNLPIAYETKSEPHILHRLPPFSLKATPAPYLTKTTPSQKTTSYLQDRPVPVHPKAELYSVQALPRQLGKGSAPPGWMHHLKKPWIKELKDLAFFHSEVCLRWFGMGRPLPKRMDLVPNLLNHFNQAPTFPKQNLPFMNLNFSHLSDLGVPEN